MSQQLVIYGDVKHPHVYATAYDPRDIEQQILRCCQRHGNDCRARAINAQKLPPSRIKA